MAGLRTNKYLWVIVGAMLLSGCRSFDLPSWPWLDKLGLRPAEPVPEEVLARHGPTSMQRIERIEGLGKQAAKSSSVQQQQIAEALAQQIQSEQDSLVRAAIVDAISECRVPIAGAVMRAALQDVDMDVQRAACRAWGRWGSPEAVQLLGQMVADNDAPLDVRLAAVSELQQIKDPSSASALAAALGPRQDPAIQYRAVEALQDVTDLDYGNDLVAWRNHFANDPAYLAGQRPPAPTSMSPGGDAGRVAPVGFQQ
jgi:hypothetical protein